MDAANLGFVARQLMLTELAGDVEDTAGGCLVWDSALWVGLWDIAAIEDAEQFILSVQQQSRERGVPWRGVVLLLSPGEESSPAVAELGEALYVYGLPRCEGLDGGGPDMVQVLAKPAKTSAPGGLEIAVSADPGDAVLELIAQAMQVKDALAAPWQRRQSQWPEESTSLVAQLDGQPVGVLLAQESELASRAVLLWVAPAARGKCIGSALMTQSAGLALAAGRVLHCAWTYRAEKLRYYFSKLGYEEQLSAQYFLAESTDSHV